MDDEEAVRKTASQMLRRLGYEVRRVDCTDTYPHFGSLRCLVNVMRRSPVRDQADPASRAKSGRPDSRASSVRPRKSCPPSASSPI